MPDDDDQHWLEAVAGKPAPSAAAPATLREGAVVRQAMMASQRAQPRLDVEAGTRRLLARLREERLLRTPGLMRFGWKLPALAMVLMLAIAFGVALRERRAPKAPPRADVPVLKGEPDAPQEIVTPDAREIAAEVRDTMTRAGLTPSVTERGSGTRLEAAWPRNPSAAQLDFLRLYGFARPNGTQLRIDVRTPPE